MLYHIDATTLSANLIYSHVQLMFFLPPENINPLIISVLYGHRKLWTIATSARVILNYKFTYTATHESIWTLIESFDEYVHILCAPYETFRIFISSVMNRPWIFCNLWKYNWRNAIETAICLLNIIVNILLWILYVYSFVHYVQNFTQTLKNCNAVTQWLDSRDYVDKVWKRKKKPKVYIEKYLSNNSLFVILISVYNNMIIHTLYYFFN